MGQRRSRNETQQFGIKRVNKGQISRGLQYFALVVQVAFFPILFGDSFCSIVLDTLLPLQSLDRISSPKAKQRKLYQFPDTPPTNLR